MAKYSIDSTTLTGIGDAIRAKEGSSGTIPVTQIASRISAIETGKALPTLSNPGGADDLRAGKQLIDQEGNVVTGTALVAGGGVYPDGAFAPVKSFTAGKQYALVAVIDGVRRYINTTAYNDWTLNATQIGIAEDTGDYVIFDANPALFTAVASGNGFLLQTGSDNLYGVFDGGTALRIGTTQTVWLVDESETAGLPDGKFYPKEDSNAVWLTSTHDDYDWFPKYETAGSFGYDRVGRDDTYSTGFVSFVLYEYVAGEGEINPVMDTTGATATAGDILSGKTAFANGRKVTGSLVTQTFYRGASEPSADLGNDYDLYFVMG